MFLNLINIYLQLELFDQTFIKIYFFQCRVYRSKRGL